ncbi:MAG: methionine synthase [Candidatus Melainabacteria bacterium]|nr:methionine synthase [Candidatus Melainabacteria bacterium]
MASKSFLEVLKEKVIIFDGAMGTSIHSLNLTLDDYINFENCPEILVESRPDAIKQIHASFFDVGCDIVETDTFGGSPVVLAEFDLQDRAYELNKKAAKIACEVASSYKDKPRFVSGSIGPTTKLPSLGHISFKAMRDAYAEQVRGLIDGGVDCLQFETGQDLLQAKAAILAMLDTMKKLGKRIPIITQVTIEAPPMGTMLVGSDISAALTTLQNFDVDVIGINCATGPSEMLDPVRYLCGNTSRYVSVLPNAGLPENIGGETVYKLTPDELATALKRFALEDGVNIIGGCCGTTPVHLKRVVEVVGEIAPKKRNPLNTPAVASIYTSVPLEIDQPPLIVGERTNTNGSRLFKQLLEKDDLDGMVNMAREQEHEGAHLLDVCTAYVGRDEVRDMTVFIEKLNTQIQLPLVIDTTEFNVLEESLQYITGRPLVNSINLEDGVEHMKKKIALIKRYGAATIALTIDESGMAKNADKKLEVAKRIYDLALGGGLKPEDLVFDALTFTLSTGNDDDRRLGLETLNGISMIKAKLPGVKTILGVSNISFGFDPKIRKILNSVFLHYAVEHGLDSAIVNAQKILPLFKISEEEREFHRKLIFDERTPDYDPLFALLDYYKSQEKTSTKSVEDTSAKSIEDVLKQRIINGNRVNLEKDLDIALAKYKPLDIINDILLDGMKVVGDLFGAGKMQLPFVLQSAETMKACVRYLEPFMEKSEGSTRGTMVLATVKGDVHDIGKNLVDIILSNNGYKVHNLGIKQPIENIIASAVEHKADCIGMSGLLVKSTVIMKENLSVMNDRSISTPVILGGAALTRRYVEEDCRSVYNGNLFYGADAFDDLKIMEALFKLREQGKKDIDINDVYALTGHEKAAQTNKAPRLELSLDSDSKADSEEDRLADGPPDSDDEVSLSENNGRAEAVKRLPKSQIPEPPFWGTKVLEEISLEDVFAHVNKNVLIRGQWRVRQGSMTNSEYSQMLEEKVLPELEELKKRCKDEGLLLPKAVYGYFPCRSEGNDLIIYKNDMKTERLRFIFPRQDHGQKLCISDFFSDAEPDVVAMQIATVGRKASKYSKELFENDKYTDYLYFHGLSVESAEGTAEVVHKRIRQELGFGDEDAKEIEKLFQQGYRGTRYSFGYPACPSLEDQSLLFELLDPGRIAVDLTEEFQLVPEQSTSAIVVHHPQAKYFNIKGKSVVTT